MSEIIRLQPSWLGRIEERILMRFIELGYLKGKYILGIRLHNPESRRFELMADRFYWREAELKKWKIDAVCETPNMIWILEVTERPRDSAIGHLIKYESAYREQFKPKKPISLGLITAIDDPAYHPILRQLHITHWVVPV